MSHVAQTHTLCIVNAAVNLVKTCLQWRAIQCCCLRLRRLCVEADKRRTHLTDVPKVHCDCR